MRPPPLTAAELRRRAPSLMWLAPLLWIGLFLGYSLPADDVGGEGGFRWVLYGTLFLTVLLVLPVLRRVGTALSCALSGATVLAVHADPPGFGETGALGVLAVVTVGVLLLSELEARRQVVTGPLETWPGPAPAPRGTAAVASGIVLASLALLAGLVTAVVGVHQAHRESSASLADGTVVAIPDETTLTVRAGQRVNEVDVYDSSEWQVGEVDVFYVDAGGPFRSVDEPFDVTPVAALLAGLLALGLALVLRGWSGRRGSGAPLPVRSVRVLPWGAGVLLYPDELGHGGPVLASVTQVVPHPAPVVEDWPVEPGVPEPAVVYGIPRPGQPVRVRTRDTLLVGVGGAR